LSKRRNSNITFWEYNDPIWRKFNDGSFMQGKEGYEYGSFHFKGTWLSKENDGLARDFILGSSPQDQRSFNKDYEMQIYATCNDEDFRKRSW
jgi:hypothetical protein